MDRATVHETDAGDGTPLPAIVAVPRSAPTGVLVNARLVGGLRDDDRMVLIAAVDGATLPIPPLMRVAGSVGHDAVEIGAADAARAVAQARETYRRRRAMGRQTDRPAWLPLGMGSGQVVSSGQSGAEARLARLPLRFVRGLSDLLDRDERVLASVRREEDDDPGWLPWRRRDRRAALLALTDRQLIWLTDHSKPSSYRIDWGVDGTLVPLEAMTSLDTGPAGISVRTRGGIRDFSLATDATRELDDLRHSLAAFLTGPNDGALMRRYELEPMEFDLERLAPFKQMDEARDRLEHVVGTLDDPAISSFYAPRREGVPRAVVALLTSKAVVMDDVRTRREVALRDLRSVSIGLSPLGGRLEIQGGTTSAELTYPGPLRDAAAAFVRQVRKAWANA